MAMPGTRRRGPNYPNYPNPNYPNPNPNPNPNPIPNQVLDGVARLTDGQMNAAGSLLLVTPHRALSPPPREFNLTFDVLVGFSPGEAEGDGAC